MSESVDPLQCCQCRADLAAGHALCASCHEDGFPVGAPEYPDPGWQQFGDYRLERCIGTGSSGEVWEAYHPYSGAHVALKRMIFWMLQFPEKVAQFREEIRVQSSLRHRNIIPLLDSGEYLKWPYYTMPLMHSTLRTRIDHYAQEPQKAAALVACLARSLHPFHEKGHIHRDLRPDNILFDKEGHPYLSDFGEVGQKPQSRVPDPDSAPAGSKPSQSQPPTYQSPEQLLNGPINRYVDLYQLGILLAELVTASRPGEWKRNTISFEFGNDASAESFRADAARIHLPAIPERIHSHLRPVILSCTNSDWKRRQNRYPTALSLADDLERFVRGEITRSESPGRWGELRRTGKEQRRELGWLGFLLVLIFASLVAMDWREVQTENDSQEQLVTEDAKRVSETVSLQLRHFGMAIAAAANEVETRLLMDRDREALGAWCERKHGEYNAPRTGLIRAIDQQSFERIYILNRDGLMDAIFPGKSIVGQSFAERDFFVKAKRSFENQEFSAASSRAFVAQCDLAIKFAISAPIVREGEFWGAVVGTVAADDKLGSLGLQTNGRTVMIVAERDPYDEKSDAPMTRPCPSEDPEALPTAPLPTSVRNQPWTSHVLLIHPALNEKGGKGIMLPGNLADAVQSPLWNLGTEDSSFRERFVDPVASLDRNEAMLLLKEEYRPGTARYQEYVGRELMAAASRVQGSPLTVIVEAELKRLSLIWVLRYAVGLLLCFLLYLILLIFLPHRQHALKSPAAPLDVT